MYYIYEDQLKQMLPMLMVNSGKLVVFLYENFNLFLRNNLLATVAF